MWFFKRFFVSVLTLVFMTGVLPTATSSADTLIDVPIMRIPVSFWDFKDNGNSDFKLRTTIRHPGSNLNLVQPALDSEKKPVRNVVADSNGFVLNIARYYRPWTAAETTYVRADTLLVPKRVYDTIYDTTFDATTTPPTIVIIDTLPVPRTIQDSVFVKDSTKIGDPNYVNAKVDDSLQFILKPDSQYVVTVTDTNTGDFRTDTFITPNAYQELTTDFHPINKRGLQTDTNTMMNGSYTTEIHNSFKYHGKEKLIITADDDCWAFINGQLAIDLGGPRSPTRFILVIDSLHLTAGQTYPIDIFHRQIEGGVKAKASARLDIVTDLDFVNKRLDTVDLVGIRPNLKPQAARGPVMTLAIGNSLTMKIPSATANAVFKVFNANGRMIAEYHTGKLTHNNGINLVGKLLPGAYVIKAECRDRNAGSLGNVVEKFILQQ